MDLEDFDKWKKARTKATKEKWASKLIKDNSRLVGKLVQKHLNKSTIGGELEDVMQAGYLAFMKALEGYDPVKGKFSTYLGHWIRREVQYELLRETQMHRPHGSGMSYDQHHVEQVIAAAEGRLADADDLGVDPRKLDRWRMPLEVISMDQRLEGHTCLHDSISDRDAFDVESDLDERERKDIAAHAFAKLAPLTQRIMKFVSEGMALGKIAKLEKLTREEVQATYEKGLRDIREQIR